VAPKGKIPDKVLIELFLDMVAAERGGTRNTLSAYACDLVDLSTALATTQRSFTDATAEDLRSYLASLTERFAPKTAAAPNVVVALPDLTVYDALASLEGAAA